MAHMPTVMNGRVYLHRRGDFFLDDMGGLNILYVAYHFDFDCGAAEDSSEQKQFKTFEDQCHPV